MVIYLVLAPAGDGYVPAGAGTTVEDAWDIAGQYLAKHPDLSAEQVAIFETRVNRPMQWTPVAPVPRNWRATPHRDPPPPYRPPDLPYGVWW